MGIEVNISNECIEINISKSGGIYYGYSKKCNNRT
jgi:hypothetical protein